MSQAASQFCRPRVPQVDVELHRKVRNGRRIPQDSPIHKSPVYKPPDFVGLPVEFVAVEILGSIETQIDENGRTPVAVLQLCAHLPRVVVDVHEHLGRVLAEELDVDLLSRAAAVQEHACDDPSSPGRLYLRHVAPERE